MKILFIVGVRSQFIKLAPVVKQIENADNGNLNYRILHTGQHYDHNMSHAFFEELEIPEPDLNLEVGSCSHAVQTADILKGCSNYMRKFNPDKVVVFGDTNSTLAGSLAASKLHIPIVHIEAGTRSFNMNMPEERNRVLTDRLSSYLMCPTKNTVDNLEKEGIYNFKPVKGLYNDRIVVKKTGDVMYDIFKQMASRTNNSKSILKEYMVEENGYILTTIHRSENTNNLLRLKKILSFLGKVGEKIILLAHPKTEAVIKKNKLDISENIKIFKPVGYRKMLMMEKMSKYIFTDSGGVQKEAYFFKKPCLTLRKETEWVETVSSNWNILGFGPEYKSLGDSYEKLISQNYQKLKHPSYFGNGESSKEILKYLVK